MHCDRNQTSADTGVRRPPSTAHRHHAAACNRAAQDTGQCEHSRLWACSTLELDPRPHDPTLCPWVPPRFSDATPWLTNAVRAVPSIESLRHTTHMLSCTSRITVPQHLRARHSQSGAAMQTCAPWLRCHRSSCACARNPDDVGVWSPAGPRTHTISACCAAAVAAAKAPKRLAPKQATERSSLITRPLWPRSGWLGEPDERAETPPQRMSGTNTCHLSTRLNQCS